MYGMMQKHTQEWKKIDHNRDPKFAGMPISQPAKDPNSRIKGILIHSTYGNTAKHPDRAFADFEQAIIMAKKSQQLNVPLSISTFYNMNKEGNEITNEIYEHLSNSDDPTRIKVLPETWRKTGSIMPPIVKHSLAGVTMELEMTAKQRLGHLAANTAKGAIIGVSGAVIISLAKNSSENAIEATKQVLWENKGTIATEATKRSFKAIAENAPKAIDNGLGYATEQLNNRDYTKAGEHCDYESFHESQKFFSDTVKQAGSTLKDELIYVGIGYGIELAREFAPSAVFNSSNISIDPTTVYYGGMAGAGIGLLRGVATIDDPIQKARIGDIFCKRA